MSEWDINKAIGHKFKPYEVQITNKDMILYALGIGFQRDPMNKSHYNYTYENAEEFKSFPTMNVIVGHRGGIESLQIPGVPAFNPMLLLHGEETLEIYQEIQPDSTLVCQESVLDVQDKKKAFVLVFETTIKDKESGELVSRIISNLFVRAPGGFGHRGSYKVDFP